jgi:hypothetical protein
MRYVAIAAALLAWLAAPAQADTLTACKARAAELKLTGSDRDNFMAGCERNAPTARSAPAPRSRGVGPADEDALNRAMGRNTLQSIDDQLRLRRN